MSAVQSKPDHLGPEFASQFADPSVVAAYPHRPPYPQDSIERLVALVQSPGTVLDLGTGTGEIARRLAGRVVRVDALDVSPGMIAAGQRLAGGDHPSLRWITGAAEDAPVHPPYGLIVAGASLHWMNWAIVLPRCRAVLAGDGVLALLDDRVDAAPWDPGLAELITRYSTNRRFRPYDLVDELRQRGLFHEHGRHDSPAVRITQPLASYVASFHARNGFSYDRMPRDAAEAFDRAVADLVTPYLVDGRVPLLAGGQVVWGLPG